MSLDKILPLERAFDLGDELKRRGKRVVFTNGCFDLLHPGHTRYLAEARALGDVLIVAVNSDRTVRALKGPERPIFPESERAVILAAIAAVDYVTIFDDLTPQSVIARMLPQVLAKGGDWGLDEIVGRAEVEAAGGTVVAVPLIPGFSTSAIIQSAAQNFRERRHARCRTFDPCYNLSSIIPLIEPQSLLFPQDNPDSSSRVSRAPPRLSSPPDWSTILAAR